HLPPRHPPPFPTRRSSDLSPASRPTLRLNSMIGAPVSKMNRYGPFPLILAWMTKCRLVSSSNGTLTGASSARIGGMATKRHKKRSEEHTSELQSPYELVCR